MKCLLACAAALGLIGSPGFSFAAEPGNPSTPAAEGGSANDFGAYFTHLDSKEPFEEKSKTFEYADIVVRFQSGYKFIFWRASSYRPHLDVAGKKHYVGSIIPTHGDGTGLMFDKINRYSWVKIVENTASKVVIEWRYRPDFSNLEGDAGIAYETYTLLPDGSVTRVIKRGEAKTKDWLDPDNQTVQSFMLTRDGFRNLSTKVVTRKATAEKKAQRSPIKKSLKAPVLHFGFDEGSGESARESIGGKSHAVSGHKTLWNPSPVSGAGLGFDGYNSGVTVPATEAPALKDSFSLEAWVALGAYPYNWAPIVQHSQWEESGYYFGIDAYGHLGFLSKLDGEWKKVVTQESIPTFKWTHVMASYNKTAGEIVLYINGEEKTKVSTAAAKLVLAGSTELTVGLNTVDLVPTDPIRTWATFPSRMGLDGLIDEVKLYDTAFSPADAQASYSALKPANPTQDLQPRRFPADSEKGTLSKFGASYANLAYHESWDSLWCNTSNSDVIVRFDKLPVRYVFWKGTRFSPVLVTENGKLVGDQSSENSMNWGRSNAPPITTGCCEHMSDAQTRHAHVTIVEDTPARVVVKWRYAMMDVNYNIANVDPVTGWGDWSEEWWTLYPDGTAVRFMRRRCGGWNEAMLFNADGTAPEDNVDLAAVTVVNSDGQTQLLDWSNGFPHVTISNGVIASINMKSAYKPFSMYEAGSRMSVFGFIKEKSPNSHFTAWNHYPVYQGRSDGRLAHTFDKMTHSSLLGPRAKGASVLYGFSNAQATSLLPLQKAWINAPAMKEANGCVLRQYNRDAKAYEITRREPKMSFRLDASDENPIRNLCLVFKKWGTRHANAILKLNGSILPGGPDFRQGVNIDTDGTYTLIVWLGLSATTPQNFEITE
jgi:hypothetical protein